MGSSQLETHSKQMKIYEAETHIIASQFIYGDSVMCTVPGCDSVRIKARGLCSTHYSRWYRNGDPLVIKRRTDAHGLSGTRTYSVWEGMRQRCNNPNNAYYNRYGGRGIKVCSRWDHYVNFLADMGDAPDGLWIERIDNDGGYCKENCKWETPPKQALNKSSNVIIELDGVSMCVVEWEAEIGLSRDLMYYRKKMGWSDREILTTPVGDGYGRFTRSRWNKTTSSYLTMDGESKCIAEWAGIVGINANTLHNRVTYMGWSHKKALTTPAKTKDMSLLEHNGKKDTRAGWARKVGISESLLRHRLKRGWSVEKALTTPVRRRM